MRTTNPFTHEDKGTRLWPIAGIATTGIAVTGAAAALAVRRKNSAQTGGPDELRTHVSDMMALNSFVMGEVEGHLEDETLRSRHDERSIDEEIRRMLMLHNEALHRELEALGGRGPSKMKAAAGALAGMATSMGERVLYKGMQGYPVSRMMRDGYTMLSAIAVSLTMLHATARALHRGSLADVTERQMGEAAAMVVKVSQQIPRTVVWELAEGAGDADASVSDAAVEATKQAWANAEQ